MRIDFSRSPAVAFSHGAHPTPSRISGEPSHAAHTVAGGGARNRMDTLARVAVALGRHLVLSFPERLPAKMKDAVQVA